MEIIDKELSCPGEIAALTTRARDPSELPLVTIGKDHRIYASLAYSQKIIATNLDYMEVLLGQMLAQIATLDNTKLS